jgi:hypothetical protein
MNRKTAVSILWALVGIHFAAQVVLMRHGVDNEINNRYAPHYIDAWGYVQKAELIHDESNFTLPFEDGYRTPAYPLILSVFYMVSGRPLLTVRLFQMLLGSLIIACCFFVFSRALTHPLYTLLATVPVALWPPIYFFGPIIYPESVSLFSVGLLLMACAYFFIRRDPLACTLVALCCILLVYLKPNHLLLCFPAFLFIVFTLKRRVKEALNSAAYFLLVCGIGILPWTVFLCTVTGTFTPLSSAQGLNLYLGTGIGGIGGEHHSSARSLPQRVIDAFGLYDSTRNDSIRSVAATMRLPESNRFYRVHAIKLWSERPGKTALLAVAKFFHAFGFSFRNLKDTVVALHTILSIAAALYLWRRALFRHWVVFYTGCLVSAALLSFFFLAQQRFKTVLFDIPATVILSFAAVDLYRRFFSSGRMQRLKVLFRRTA